jgi:hypothetical protein
LLLTAIPAHAFVADLAGRADRMRAYARSLRSTDEAQAREAEVRLALSGPAALDALAATGADSRPSLRPRILRILDLALCTTVTEADLRRRRGLFRLAEPRLRAASALVDSLAGCSSVGTMWVEGPGARAPDADRRLRPYGGFVVPAAIRHLRDPRVIGRALAVELIDEHCALIGRDSLLLLDGDRGEFHVFDVDYSHPESLHVYAAKTIRHLDSAWERARRSRWPDLYGRDWRPYGGDLLGHGLEEVAGARCAGPAAGAMSEWDSWWDCVRPAWRDWWDIAGPDGQSGDPREWRRALDSYQGYQLWIQPDTTGGSIEVGGPTSSQAEIWAVEWSTPDSTMLAQGPLPLRVVLPRDTILARGWEFPRYPGRTVMSGYTRVRVVFTDGHEWSEYLENFVGRAFRLEVLARPRGGDERWRDWKAAR